MSTSRDFKVYRFAEKDHWNTGLLSKLQIQRNGTVVPERPMAPSDIGIPGDYSKVESVDFDYFGTAYWRTPNGQLFWLDEGAYKPCQIEADAGIAKRSRFIMWKEWLWAFKPHSNCLLRYDLKTLQLSEVIHPHYKAGTGYFIVDIAADGHDGVWLCLKETQTESPSLICHVNSHGRTIEHIDIPADIKTQGITYLAKPQLIVLLGENGKAITLLKPSSPANSVTVFLDHEDEAQNFTATHIDSDGKSKIVLIEHHDKTELDKEKVNDANHSDSIMLLDSSGGLIEHIDKTKLGNERVNDASLSGSILLVATNQGILGFSLNAATEDAKGLFLSPALYSPDNLSLRGWLRAEISAVLPKGATMTIKVLGTDDPEILDEVKTIFHNAKLPPTVRQNKIETILETKNNRDYVFTSPQDQFSSEKTLLSSHSLLSPATYTVPLFEHSERWLWLEVVLNATSDSELPELLELRVIYPEISLSQYVPAIFRGDVTGRDPKAGDPSGFFRQLLGVLETTTQGIDQTITHLGKNIHPATAKGEWLDFIARWLGLPWDDGLPEQIKRRILNNAAQLLAQRGTRAGLELLLQLLFPNGQSQVIDVNVDFGLVILGGDICQGSSLPALLTGLPADAAILSRRAVLGKAKLSSGATDPVGAAQFKGLLRIEISASAQERYDLKDIMERLVSEIIPAGLRINIRWRTDISFTQKLDQGFILDNPSPRHLGQDARLGLLVLGGKRNVRLAETGIHLGFRLN